MSSRQTWGPPERPGATGACRADSKQANAEATSPDWSLPRGVCACARAGRPVAPCSQPTERNREGGLWHPPSPETGHYSRAVEGFSKNYVLVLRMTRLFIFTTKLQVSPQGHLVQCRPNRLHVSCAHLSIACVSWVPLLTANFSGLCSLRPPRDQRLGLPSEQSSLQLGQGPIPQPESSALLGVYGGLRPHRDQSPQRGPQRGLGGSCRPAATLPAAPRGRGRWARRDSGGANLALRGARPGSGLPGPLLQAQAAPQSGFRGARELISVCSAVALGAQQRRASGDSHPAVT